MVAVATTDRTKPRQEIWPILVDLIRPGNNDRKRFADAEIQELAHSIHELGLLQPITVRPIPSRKGSSFAYEIVAGERRWRAYKLLSVERIPAIIHELTDEEASALMLVENTARQDLGPMELARAFAARRDTFGWDERRIAQVSGLAVSLVRRRLALLRLAPELQALVEAGQLKLGHAEKIVDLDTDRQRVAVRHLNERRLNMWAFQELVARLTEAQAQGDMFVGMTFDVAGGQEAVQDGFNLSSPSLSLPGSRELPKPVMKQGDTMGDILARYAEMLARAGLDREAAALGRVYDDAVAKSWLRPRKL